MSINEKSKEEIIERLQITEYENDEYNKLIFNKILPSLNINALELNNIGIDMFNTIICKKIHFINDELKKNNTEIE